VEGSDAESQEIKQQNKMRIPLLDAQWNEAPKPNRQKSASNSGGVTTKRSNCKLRLLLCGGAMERSIEAESQEIDERSGGNQ
jgi:hypothetical protein